MTDQEIIDELHAAVAEERRSTKRVLLALIEFDERALALTSGYSTTFEYCMKRLGYSGNGAYKRINVARLAKSHPEIIGKIESGALSLSAAAAIFPYARKPEGSHLLADVEGKTVREVEKIVAQLNPVAEAPRDVIRPVALIVEPATTGNPAGPSAPPAPPQLAYRVSITLSDEGYEKLKRATDLLRHKHPKGEPHEILEDALEALLDAVDRGRKEKPSRPVRESAPGSRHVPEWVKDLVWKRDGGRCAFIARDGHRCEATSFLQYDHVVAFALGGASDDPRNVRLLCAAHNRQAARDAGLPPGPVDGAARGCD